MSQRPAMVEQEAMTKANVVMTRCSELACCSEEKARLTRRFLSAPMREVHTSLAGWMRNASLEPHVDHAGNMIGRLQGTDSSQTLIIGSHLDTVVDAGHYDGVLGVLMGLAVAELLSDEELPFNLDVIGFSEEEGIRFNKPYLGSSAVAGVFQSDWLERTDRTGVTLREAISAFNLDPEKTCQRPYRKEKVIGYIEPHLEQGPVLERAKIPVGIVSGIAGQSRLRMEFLGEVGHAGTTPMLGRSDALVAAAKFVTKVDQLGCEVKGLRATVGSFDVFPNASNVIPGRVVLSLDVRHIENALREKAVDDLIQAATQIAQDSRVKFELLEVASKRCVSVDKELTSLLSQTISELGISALAVPSGAGHDAVVMSERFPISMMFIRHPGAVSHHPDERVELDDVAVGIEVLARYVMRIAKQVANQQINVNTLS